MQPSTDAANAQHPDLIGQILGGAYRVLRQLDAGGMGMVYEAEHVRLRRPLAVKIMAGHLAQDENALARFHREAEIVSQLEHPHIVQVIDFDTTPAGQPFLVMELLRGISLESRLERGLIAIDEAVLIATQAASGLSAAHRRDIVHRDLKPANIFLLDSSDQVFVKLLDFGISKRTGHSRGLTGEFDILGTPDYMAPEQALGRTALVDHRGDQFALAVITYEMLTGSLPFAADEVMEVLQRVIRDTPTAPSVVRPEIPQRVDDVILRALSKRPEERFDSIAEFAEALSAAWRSSGRPSGIGYSPTIVPNSVTNGPPHPALALTGLREALPARPTPPREADARTLSNDGAKADDEVLTERLPTSLPPVVPAARASQSFGAANSSGASSGTASQASSPRPPVVAPQLPSTPPVDRSSSSSANAGDPKRRQTSWSKKDPVATVRDLVARAHQELGLDSLELSHSYAESALTICDELSSNPELRQEVERSTTVLERVFERYIGRLDAAIVLGEIPSGIASLSPQQAFVLSRVDGYLTVEEAIDLSPLPRVQTLRHVAGLVRAGHLRLDRTTIDRPTQRRRTT
jgi:serine/threonine-protein kinase